MSLNPSFICHMAPRGVSRRRYWAILAGRPRLAGLKTCIEISNSPLKLSFHTRSISPNYAVCSFIVQPDHSFQISYLQLLCSFSFILLCPCDWEYLRVTVLLFRMEGGRWPFRAWLELLKVEIARQRQDPRDPALFTRSMQVTFLMSPVVLLTWYVVDLHSGLHRRAVLCSGGAG